MSTQPGPDRRTQSELLDDLRYGPSHQHRRALSRLSAVGEAEALDAVIEHMREQPPGSAIAALDTLRVLAGKYMPFDRYGLAEVVIPFLEAKNWNHRLIATRLLNMHPNELATDTLRDLVDEALDRVSGAQSPSLASSRQLAERVLGESILAMANCGRLLVLPEILEFLDDPPLRAVATRALGVIGSETERIRLEDLCEDDDVHVRDAAQWSLGLIDERIEQFTKPPDQQPEPPPDRLHPIYWAHRQLWASDDDILQFLIVRLAIERLFLDGLISEGRIPENCLITVRSYEGDTPPEYRGRRRKGKEDTAEEVKVETVGAWAYHWHGPRLDRLAEAPRIPSLPELRRKSKSTSYRSAITINYPESLPLRGEGKVGFDCLFGPFISRGWIYHVALRGGEWTFSLVKRAWSG